MVPVWCGRRHIRHDIMGHLGVLYGRNSDEDEGSRVRITVPARTGLRGDPYISHTTVQYSTVAGGIGSPYARSRT